MKLAYATLALLLATTSAHAWTAQTGGSGPQAIGQDGGSATAQKQGQRQTQGQSQSARSASRSSSTSGATGGTSNVSVNNTLGGSGGGSGNGGGRAPDLYLPSIGASGMDCPTVGVGVGGSGLSGGGILSASTISSSCNQRKVVDILSNLFGPGVAREYAIQNIAGVKEALASATKAQPPAPLHPSWCIASNGQWLSDLNECGEDPR